MTRKDYTIIAEILGYTKAMEEKLDAGLDNDGIRKGIDSILEKTNPNYNPEKFWQEYGKQKLMYKGTI